jgi:sRNA-binding carbon storage regulator CsrA
MLIRKLKEGDCMTVGGIVIVVKKITMVTTTIGIQAPEETTIHHARAGEVSDPQ